MSLSTIDFAAGWAGGVCGLLVGHPADTLKVRQQVSAGRGGGGGGVLRLLAAALRSEGPLALYRGVAFPLLAAGAQNALFFGVFGNALRLLQTRQGADPQRRTCAADGEGGPPNPGWHANVCWAGAAAGFAHTFVATPVDLVKVRLQAERGPGAVSSGQLRACVRQLRAQGGGLRPFYRGLAATLWRDVPSYGLYMLVYEHLTGCGGGPLLAGGAAGTLTWVAVTPLDVLKSRLQADCPARPRYSGLLDCALQSYREAGLAVFGRGFWVHVVRGFPVSAATFAGYEWALRGRDRV